MRRRRSGLRVALIALAALAVLVVAVAVGMSAWVSGYLRGGDFLRLVSEHTGAALRAEAGYAPLRWSGSNVYSDALRVQGRLDSPIAGLHASQVRAVIDWRAVLSGAWHVESVDVLDLKASLRTPAKGQPAPSPPAAPPPAAGILARTFSLGPIRAQRASVTHEDLRASLDDFVLTINPGSSSTEFSGRGGVFSLEGYPAVDMEEFRARLSKGVFYLTWAKGRLGEGGKIEASGQTGEGAELRIEWSGVDVRRLLPGAWERRLSGILSGEALVRTGPTPESSGKFLLSEGLLEDVPLLEKIAAFTSSPQFRRMPLQEVSGQFASMDGGWDLTGLVLESKGLLRARGTLRIAADGAIDGRFRIGVGPQVLQWLPGSRERVFTVNETGYVWTDLRLGGTLDNPTEDLSQRLTAAAAGEVMDRGTRAITDPAGTVREGAKTLLDTLAPLLP
jgi:hypothetical protein